MNTAHGCIIIGGRSSNMPEGRPLAPCIDEFSSLSRERTDQLTLFGGIAVGAAVYGQKDTLQPQYEQYVDTYIERYSGG